MARPKNRQRLGGVRLPAADTKPVRAPFCCKKAGTKSPERFTCPQQLARHMGDLVAPVVTLQPASGTAKAVIVTNENGAIAQVTACDPQTNWRPANASRTLRSVSDLLDAFERKFSGVYQIEGLKGSATVQLQRGVPIKVR